MPYLHHGDATLHYIEEGPEDAPVLLLLHGWTCDLHDWNFQVEYIHRMGFRTVAIDHRGHGRSSIPANPQSLRPEELAEDAAALLDHLNVSQAVVAGHSLGTIVASILAVRHPDKVRALILCDPQYNVPRASAGPALQHLSGSDVHAAALEIFRQRGFYTSKTPEWIIAWHRRRALDVPDSVVFDTLSEAYGKEDSPGVMENALECFRERKAPRLVICGLESSAVVDRELPLSEKDQIVVIPDAGHWPHQQEPDQFNKIVGEWLNRLDLVPLSSSKAT